jgi:hypothetical protein
MLIGPKKYTKSILIKYKQFAIDLNARGEGLFSGACPQPPKLRVAHHPFPHIATLLSITLVPSRGSIVGMRALAVDPGLEAPAAAGGAAAAAARAPTAAHPRP